MDLQMAYDFKVLMGLPSFGRGWRMVLLWLGMVIFPEFWPSHIPRHLHWGRVIYEDKTTGETQI